jgi:glutathione S-transferase
MIPPPRDGLSAKAIPRGAHVDSHRLILHEHPFASYCQKVLIALYELDLPFGTRLITDEASRRELASLWPLEKMPVLRDETAGLMLPESTTIIEYLDSLAPGGPRLVPGDPAAALQARLWDRFHDQYVMNPMQKIVGDELRPDGRRDTEGVSEARRTLDTAYGILDGQLASTGTWTAGRSFTIADCAAAPALFYARAVHRWDERLQPNVARYYRDLMAWPSVARVVDEARPYRELFPLPWPDDFE